MKNNERILKIALATVIVMIIVPVHNNFQGDRITPTIDMWMGMFDKSVFI